MKSFNQLARPVRYALLSAISAGILAAFMINTFIDLLTWIFVPSVMIMVFISAYFAFRRQMRGKGRLERRKLFQLAMEVGTVSHVYTFALYLPLNYFLVSQDRSLSPEVFAVYLGSILLFSFFSLIMFIWISVPLYLGIGYVMKSTEESMQFDEFNSDEVILDEVISKRQMKLNDDLDF